MIAQLLGSVLLAAEGSFHHPADLEQFLEQHLRFTAKELVRLRAGRPVGKCLPSAAPGELVLGGAVRLNVTRAQYLRWYGDPANWTLTPEENRPAILAAGILPAHPALGDFAGLSLEPQDRERLAQEPCVPGSCSLKADRALIAELARGLAPDNALRRSWLDTAHRYLASGPTALPEVVDRRVPVRLSDELAGLLRASAYLWVISPRMAAALSRAPAASPHTERQFLFWTRERYGYGLKTTAALYHAEIAHLTGQATVIVTTQLRATHYFEGSLAVTLLVDQPDGRAWFVYLNRSRIDALRGGWGARLRPLIDRGAPRSARGELTALRDRLDSWLLNQPHRSAVTYSPPPKRNTSPPPATTLCCRPPGPTLYTGLAE